MIKGICGFTITYLTSSSERAMVAGAPAVVFSLAVVIARGVSRTACACREDVVRGGRAAVPSREE